ncbi:Transketolase, partial [Durusdinium trenchii]
ESVVRILKQLDAETRKRQVLVIDNDLEGSCGLKKVGDAFPEVYVKGGIMERLRRPDTG